MMDNTQSVTVTCDGEELLSWDFEFPQATREDIRMAPGWLVEEGIGISVVNTQGITKLSVGENMADRRRDDNLREMFGG